MFVFFYIYGQKSVEKKDARWVQFCKLQTVPRCNMLFTTPETRKKCHLQLQFGRICKKQGKGYSHDVECGMLTNNGRNRQRNDKNRKLCDGNVQKHTGICKARNLFSLAVLLSCILKVRR